MFVFDFVFISMRYVFVALRDDMVCFVVLERCAGLLIRGIVVQSIKPVSDSIARVTTPALRNEIA